MESTKLSQRQGLARSLWPSISPHLGGHSLCQRKVPLSNLPLVLMDLFFFAHLPQQPPMPGLGDSRPLRPPPSQYKSLCAVMQPCCPSAIGPCASPWQGVCHMFLDPRGLGCLSAQCGFLSCFFFLIYLLLIEGYLQCCVGVCRTSKWINHS